MLISIEGNDGSGKETQSKMLYEFFQKNNIDSGLVAFPNYDCESSSLVKMYLNGSFGDSPDDVDPKAASIFYACDRYASYKMFWEKDFREGKVIISDRYTTSNVIHQASKIDDIQKRDEFIAWLFDLEYNIFGIPKPNETIFLNMPFEFSRELIRNRRNKFSGKNQKDIHEANEEYLIKTYKNTMDILEKLAWIKIDCVDENNQLKSIEAIHQEIVDILIKKYEFKR
ncbi:MAG: thymidylate kinase [Peptostreptococcaceae bacterium]|nr:thymidylate kinase [Peptostreptococcaceae bacterium]